MTHIKKQPEGQTLSTRSVNFFFHILFSNDSSVLQFLIVDDNVV